MIKKLAKLKMDIFNILLLISSISILIFFSLNFQLKQNIYLFSLLIFIALNIVSYSLFNLIKSIHQKNIKTKLNKFFTTTTEINKNVQKNQDELFSQFNKSQIELNLLTTQSTKLNEQIEKKRIELKDLIKKDPAKAKDLEKEIYTLNNEHIKQLSLQKYYLEHKTIQEQCEEELKSIQEKLNKINANELITIDLNTISSFQVLDIHRRTTEWKTLLENQNKIFDKYNNILKQDKNKLIDFAKKQINQATNLINTYQKLNPLTKTQIEKSISIINDLITNNKLDELNIEINSLKEIVEPNIKAQQEEQKTNSNK